LNTEYLKSLKLKRTVKNHKVIHSNHANSHYKLHVLHDISNCENCTHGNITQGSHYMMSFPVTLFNRLTLSCLFVVEMTLQINLYEL